tara:strand:+ start:47 stop:1387 length:1341 start_codon:yes stop_codon:yes gene_type:complete
MANKNLLTANQMYVDQQNFDVGGEIAKQFGNVMKGYNDFKVKLNEDAMSTAEDLNADAVGVDLMSGESQEWITGEFDRLGTEIATARANGDKKLVRKLETEGAELIGVQNQLGNLLKEHAENKLAGNYSKSADQDMLDLLITKRYTIGKNKDGQVVVNFNKDTDFFLTGKFDEDPVKKEAEIKRIETAIAASESDSEKDSLEVELAQIKGKGFERDWQEEGILLKDLDKHIRVKDDTQGSDYSDQLDELAKQSQKGVGFAASKDKTQKIINAATETTDQLQTSLFDDVFLQDGKTLAEVWAEDPKHKDLDPNKYLKSNGSEYYTYESELKKWTRNKLLTAAENHHGKNAETYGQMTQNEKTTLNAVKNIDNFLAIENPTPNDMLMLGNATTKIEMTTDEDDGVEVYVIKKWSNGDWVEFQSIRKDTDPAVTKRVFQNALGANEQVQ